MNTDKPEPSTETIQEWHDDMAVGIPDWYDLAAILLSRLEAAEQTISGMHQWIMHKRTCPYFKYVMTDAVAIGIKCTCGLHDYFDNLET